MKLQQENRNSTRRMAGERLPHFLNQIESTNEYTPKLHAAPLKPNGAMFCSPKDWPETAAYPTGFKKSLVSPNSHTYLRETTAGSTARPATTPDRRLLHAAQLDDDETVHMQSSIQNDREHRRLESLNSRMESRRSKAEFLSRPRTKHMMRIQAGGLIPQGNIKYSGNQVIVRANQPTSYDKHMQSVRRRGSQAVIGSLSTLSSVTSAAGNFEPLGSTPLDSFQARWLQTLRFVKVLMGTSRNLVKFEPEPSYLSGVNNLDITMQEFRSVTKNNKHPTLIYRDQFIHALTTKIDGMTPVQANSFFSAFDMSKKNLIHYANVLGACLVVIKPEQSSLDCLEELWRLFKAHKGSYQAMKNCGEILMLPCANKEDVDLMEKELKLVFRPAAYRIAAATEIKPKVESPEGAGATATKSSSGSNGQSDKLDERFGGQEKAARKDGENEKQPLRPTTTTFNLCNGIMDLSSFMSVCSRCPSTVALFDRLRRELLNSSNAKAAAKVRKKTVSERLIDMQKRKISLAV